MPNILYFIFMIFLSLPGFSQEESVKEPLSPHGGHVTIRQSPDLAPTEAVPAEAPSLNDDAEIREIEAARLKQIEKMNKIQEATKPLANPVLSPLEEIQKLGYKQIDAMAMLDDKVLAILQRALKDGPLDKLPPEAIKVLILERVKGTFWEDILKKSPKLLAIVVDLVKDKEALSGLLGILVRKDDLKNYGYLWLAIFIFGLYVKTRIIKPKWPFFKRFRYGLSVSVILTSVSLYLFYSFFEQELSPVLSILARHF